MGMERGGLRWVWKGGFLGGLKGVVSSLIGYCGNRWWWRGVF